MARAPQNGDFYIQRSNQDFWLRENGVWVRKGNIRDEGSSGLVGVQPIMGFGFNQASAVQRIRYLGQVDKDFGLDNSVDHVDRIRLLVAALNLGFSDAVALRHIRLLTLSLQLGYAQSASAVHRSRMLAAAMDLGLDLASAVDQGQGEEEIAAAMQLGFSQMSALERHRYIAASIGLGFDEAANVLPLIKEVSAQMALGFNEAASVLHAPPGFLVYTTAASPRVVFLDGRLSKLADPASLPNASPTALAISPDDRWVAVGAPNTAGSANEVWMYDLSSGQPVYSFSVTLTSGQANDVAFNAAGTRMAIALSASPWVRVIETTGWTDVTAPAPGKATRCVAWSPDGTKLACGFDSSSPDVAMYNTTTMAAISGVPTSGMAPAIRDMQFSPSGAYLAIIGSSTPYIAVMDVVGLTVLSNPASLPPSGPDLRPTLVSWRNNSQKVTLVHSLTPFFSNYSLSGGVLTKDANPSSLPSNTGRAVAYKKDGSKLWVMWNNASTAFYQYSVSTWTKDTNPSHQPNAAPLAMVSTI